MFSTADTSAELVKLCKTETLCIFNHHDCSIRHVNTDFNNGSWNQNLYLVCRETLHDLIFFGGFHFAVKIFYLNIWRKDRFDFCSIIQDIFCVESFTLFYHRTDDIYLSSLLHLSLDKGICLWAIRNIYNTVFDRKSFGRKLVDHRDIEISVQNDCQSSWNRCCTHDENIGRVSAFSKRFALLDTEAVLLISDDKWKIFVDYFFLNQCVCTNDDLCFARSNFCINFTLFFCSIGTCEQYCTKIKPLLF